MWRELAHLGQRRGSQGSGDGLSPIWWRVWAHRRGSHRRQGTTHPALGALAKHHSELVGHHLRDLFAEDPARGERFCAEAAGIYLDYSKNRITDETLSLLLQLAQQSQLERHREAMFAGERINVSENRSVLHVALRMPRGTSLMVDGVDVVAEVHEVLDRMAEFA